MPDRMQRMWAPINLVDASLVAGATLRVDVLSNLEAFLGRELRAWTVTRVVGTLQVVGADSQYYYGLRVENENVALGVIDPEADATADWILHGSVWTQSTVYYPRDVITIDNRSQRKSRGEQSKLYFYVENASLVAGSVTLVGRALMLLP